MQTLVPRKGQELQTVALDGSDCVVVDLIRNKAFKEQGLAANVDRLSDRLALCSEPKDYVMEHVIATRDQNQTQARYTPITADSKLLLQDILA